MAKVVISIVVAVIIALVVGFVPIMEVPYTETVRYQDTETYTETVPLSYEVVESYTDTGSYSERRRIVIGGVVFQDEIVEVFYPVFSVSLQNKDNVSGEFAVYFILWTLDKLDAAMFGHPDFNFTDYLAAEDPDSYLYKLDWSNLDWSKTLIYAETYTSQENVTLEPDKTGTVRASMSDIDMDKDVWKWEYTITEPTKTVEKERTVTKERPETHYKKVPIFEYLLSKF